MNIPPRGGPSTPYRPDTRDRHTYSGCSTRQRPALQMVEDNRMGECGATSACVLHLPGERTQSRIAEASSLPDPMLRPHVRVLRCAHTRLGTRNAESGIPWCPSGLDREQVRRHSSSGPIIRRCESLDTWWSRFRGEVLPLLEGSERECVTDSGTCMLKKEEPGSTHRTGRETPHRLHDYTYMYEIGRGIRTLCIAVTCKDWRFWEAMGKRVTFETWSLEGRSVLAQCGKRSSCRSNLKPVQYTAYGQCDFRWNTCRSGCHASSVRYELKLRNAFPFARLEVPT